MLQEGLPHRLLSQQGALCQHKPNSCLYMRSTLSSHLCGKDNQCHGPNYSNNRSKWSSLPDLILCLIKDKLDVIDDTRLSAVCRDWLSASRFYPPKFSGGDGLPWIMQTKYNFTGTVEFISVTRNKKFTLNMPEFYNASFISSKAKWFLVQGWPRPPTEISVYLVNPFTKVKIELPCTDLGVGYIGSFSLCKGYPNLVVIFEHCLKTKKVTVRTACPGDASWTVHSYVRRGRSFQRRQNVLMIDEYVYWFDSSGYMIVYNMANHSWKELPGSYDTFSSIMEFEGELVRVCQSGNDYKQISFYRFSNADSSWQQLNSDVIKDVSWFLLTNCCFCVRTKNHSKVYSVFNAKLASFKMLNSFANNPNYRHKIGELVRGGPNIVVDNLMNGDRTVLDLPCRISGLATWVDLG